MFEAVSQIKFQKYMLYEVFLIVNKDIYVLTKPAEHCNHSVLLEYVVVSRGRSL